LRRNKRWLKWLDADRLLEEDDDRKMVEELFFDAIDHVVPEWRKPTPIDLIVAKAVTVDVWCFWRDGKVNVCVEEQRKNQRDMFLETIRQSMELLQVTRTKQDAPNVVPFRSVADAKKKKVYRQAAKTREAPSRRAKRKAGNR